MAAPKLGMMSVPGTVAPMLNSEIQAVVVMMRQNAKWANGRYADDDLIDDPLVHDFKMLRQKVFTWTDWERVSPIWYLSPFLGVIRSEETGAPITGVALSALYKILTVEIFNASTVQAQEAMHAIVDAVTGCRFEVTDPASEEVVLMKILQVLLACLRCGAGSLLTDRDVCNILNACFRVVHQSVTKGELLQRMACHSMQEMVRTIFSKLSLHDGDADDGAPMEEGVMALPADLDPAQPHETETEAATPSDSANGDGEASSPSTPNDNENGAGLPNGGEGEAAIPDGSRKEEDGGAPITRQENDVSAAAATDSAKAPAGRPPRPGKVVGGKAAGSMDAGDGADSADQLAGASVKEEDGEGAEELAPKPYGVACMVEIFHFLCSLVSFDDGHSGPLSAEAQHMREDMQLFALSLINSAMELALPSFEQHPKLLELVQDDLFRNLLQLGLSLNPLLLSMVCGIVLQLYNHMRSHLKLQLEAFFTFVIIRLAQGKHSSSYEQQEVAMEALVDFCRQPTFMVEMYANFDCDIQCSNVFEDLSNLLSKSAFPVNSPLTAMHVLALEGLLAFVHSMADRTDSSAGPAPQTPALTDSAEYVSFWRDECESYEDPKVWIDFVRRRKYVKRRLMIGADHFNRDPKKGLEFLQEIKLLPQKLDPSAVACFFRFTPGLQKNLLGEYFGDPDDFCVKVLYEFSMTFDFADMNLDAALRQFLESFRLPGEAQKISRVLEAFSSRFYDQAGAVFANKDAAYILSYSIIMLNTDQHNNQVKRKMTLEEFIRNNRKINNGDDLPRDMLSEIYHGISQNEIRMNESSAGVPEMTYSRWVNLLRRSLTATPYIACDPGRPLLDSDMFAIISGPTIAAISVVFDHAEDEEVLRECMEGFLAIAKISSHHRLEDVLDDLVVSLCKFTTLLNPTATAEEPAIAFGEDTKARMAAVTVFSIANRFGDFIRTGWRNILDCVLRLHKLRLLPAKIGSELDDLVENTATGEGSGKGGSGDRGGMLTSAPLPSSRRRSSGIMSRFSQFLSLESDEPRLQPTEAQMEAQQRTARCIEACQIGQIFTDSKFLQGESLLQLARALMWAAGRPHKGGGSLSSDDEDTAVFCLDLLVTITLNNRDRILLLWPGVYEHMASIVQTASQPGLLVERVVFLLLRICRRLLPYKEDLADELLRSLQLILKLDARVADAYCERITGEVLALVRANAAHIRSPAGWRTVCSLLAITARHPDAAEPGFEALSFVMVDGAHVTPANYGPCLDAARAFAEARVGGVERSVRALDLLAGMAGSLQRWAEAMAARAGLDGSAEDRGRGSEELGEMWLRLAQGIRRVCIEPREEVRNTAVLSLQRCLLAAAGIRLPATVWTPAFDKVILVMLDDVLEMGLRSAKDAKGMEGTMRKSMALISRVFLHFLAQLASLPGFRALWLAALNRMEMYMRAAERLRAEQLAEDIPELLKNMLQVMHGQNVLHKEVTPSGDSLWELTWHHVAGISPTLQGEIFPEEAVATAEQAPAADEVAAAAEATMAPAGDEPAPQA